MIGNRVSVDPERFGSDGFFHLDFRFIIVFNCGCWIRR